MFGRRLTNPERWLTPRFRKLESNQKLIYLYILDKCDWAGFLEIDLDRVSFDTRIAENEIEPILKVLDEDEIVLGKGWLFVIDFIELQGNSNLNPNNNAHKNIIAKLKVNLKRFDGEDRVQKNVAPYEELIRGSSKGKATGTSKDQGISTVKLDNDFIWKRDFECHTCGANKGENCKIKGDCHFPVNLVSRDNLKKVI